MLPSQSWVPNHRPNPLIPNHHYPSPLRGKASQMLAETLPVGPEAMHLYTSRLYPKPFPIRLPPLRSELHPHVLLHRPERIPIKVDGRIFPLGREPCAMQDKAVPLDHEVSWSVSGHVPREMCSLGQIICRITFLGLGIWIFKPQWLRVLSHLE